MRVPIPEIQAQALPGVRVADSDLPAQHMGQLLQMAAQAKQQADTARVEDALNKTQEHVIGLKSQVSQIHGQNVMDMGEDASGNKQTLSKTMLGNFDGNVEDTISSLSNETQREMFRKNAARLRLDLQGHAETHQANELQNWQLDTYKKTNELAINAATQAAQAGDMPAVANQVQRALHASDQASTLTGQTSPEELAANRLNATSPIHAAVITNLLQTNDIPGAKSYLDANKDQIGADTAIKLGAVIKNQARIQMSETKTQAIWDAMAPTPDDFGTSVPLEKMSQALRKDPELQKDPEALKVALSNLKERASEHDYSVKSAETANIGTLWKAALSGQNYRRLPEFSNLTGTEQAHLISQVDAFRRRNENSEGSQIAHMAEVYAWTSNPQKLASAAPEEIFARAGKLGPGGLQTVLQAKQQLSSPNKVFAATVTNDQIDAMLRTNGLMGGEKGDGKASDAEKAQAVVLRNTVELQVSHDEQAKGRELTLQEKQDIIKRNILKVKVKTPGFLWPSVDDKPLFQIQDPSTIQVDPGARARIVQGYKAAGVEPTEQQILNTYLNGLNTPPAPVDLGTKKNISPSMRRK